MWSPAVGYLTPLLLSSYSQVEQLATDITLMERDAGAAVVANAA